MTRAGAACHRLITIAGHNDIDNCNAARNSEDHSPSPDRIDTRRVPGRWARGRPRPDSPAPPGRPGPPRPGAHDGTAHAVDAGVAEADIAPEELGLGTRRRQGQDRDHRQCQDEQA